ncbi:MAG: ABC transporter substrate-binding protein [Thermodesulfobacteriota bacterium]
MKLRKDVLLVAGLLVSIFLIYGTLSHAKEVRGVTDKSITIGVCFPITGPAASLGTVGLEAMRIYIRHINDSGGVNGRRLNLIVEDDRYSIPPAIAALKKLVYRDEIFALLGPGSANQVNAMWKNIEKDKLPNIPFAIPEVAVNPYKKYIFIITDTYPGQVNAITDYMLKDFKLKEQKVALVYPDSEVGKIDSVAAAERFKKYNITPVTKEILNPTAVDASTQVMSIRRYNANCVLHIGTITPTTITLLRELKKFGLNIPVFASFGAMLGEELNAIGEAANQFYSVHATSPWYGKGTGVEEMRKITLKYHPGTEKPYRGTVHTHAWVMTTVMVEGMKRAGKNLDAETLVDSLESMKNYNTGGLCAPITYSSQSHKGGDSWRIYKADPAAGKFIPMTDWRKPE